MEKFSKWFGNLIGDLLKYLLKKAVESIDPIEWLENNAKELVDDFLKKFDTDEVGEALQDKVLDPIKAWIEGKLDVNL